MKTQVLVILFLSNALLGAAQQLNKKYLHFIEQADSLYEAKQYAKSADMYSKAFRSLNWKARNYDRYNAACSWALAGKPDSALFHLEVLAFKRGDKDLEHTRTDSDLASLHDNPRWQKIIAQMQLNKETAAAKLNRPLMARLDSIYADDQNDRREIEVLEKQYGWNSPEVKALWKVIIYKDSINLIKVKSILDTYGWLGEDVIGSKGNSTLFLVIQHADQKTQEKYLPLMREAVKKNNAEASSLALLEDRVALGQGKKQIYGSQIGRDDKTGTYYVLPLKDPEHVDERRLSAGLEPLADYVKYWNIVWDVKKYKKQVAGKKEN